MSLLNRGQQNTEASLNTKRHLSGRFCQNPFRQMDFYEDGKVYSCCSTWLPQPIGDLRKQSIKEIWNSPNSQMIRESILDGSFRYCDHKVCPRIQANDLPTVTEASQDVRLATIIASDQTRLDELPEFYNFCHDLTCNLSCPSCRRKKSSTLKGLILKHPGRCRKKSI
ncbi:MAG: SPASM domain-containing protein [Gammaproteobacteria bacterium]|nr:SPASM domain-containing protein [Gammaproteobacteria bacterium]